MDWYTKLMLTVLAACAVLLAAQSFQGGPAAGAGTEEGRYRIQVIPMGRMILRFDSETGKAWKSTFPEAKFWAPIADEPVETLDDAAPEKPATPESPEAGEPKDAVAP